VGVLYTCYGGLIYGKIDYSAGIKRHCEMYRFHIHLPAINHEFIDGSRASRGRGLAVTSLDQSKHLVVCVL
jgi:hypothetical protein